MRFIFGLTKSDIRLPGRGKRALIGSPGVGKSVLFFLVALHKACHTPVVYYRKTQNRDDQSLFFMNATKNKKVNIVFTRNSLDEINSKKILMFLKEQHIDGKSYYRFVDGPKHDESDELFNRYFDYFCTSGGYPIPKQEEQDRDRLWILDAWTEDEAIAALTDPHMPALKPSSKNEVSTVTPSSVDAVKKVYWLCGGSIRNMLKACNSSYSFTATQEHLEAIVDNLGRNTIEVAVTFTVRRGDPSDSIRSMFRNINGHNTIMRAIQIVDSAFLLGLLSDSLDIGQLHAAMQLAKSMADKGVQGVYFEHCCHRCFKALITSTSPGVHFWLKAVVQKDIKDMEKFNDNTYWLPPSKQNYPDIDAAFVHGGILYALQYTVGQKHSFDFERFWNVFTFAVYGGGNVFSSVYVVFVVPRATTTFRLPIIPKKSEFILKHGDGEGPTTRSSSQTIFFSIDSNILEVDTNTVDAMKDCLSNLLVTLPKLQKVEQLVSDSPKIAQG
jgi:hypothetical protein